MAFLAEIQAGQGFQEHFMVVWQVIHTIELRHMKVLSYDTWTIEFRPIVDNPQSHDWCGLQPD